VLHRLFAFNGSRLGLAEHLADVAVPFRAGHRDACRIKAGCWPAQSHLIPASSASNPPPSSIHYHARLVGLQ
jgi:hypothetical protein